LLGQCAGIATTTFQLSTGCAPLQSCQWLKDGFLVKIPPSEATFEIKTDGDPQARAFNEHVFATLKKWFEGASDLSSNDSPRGIGFRA